MQQRVQTTVQPATAQARPVLQTRLQHFPISGFALIMGMSAPGVSHVIHEDIL
jgi:hypothetical protein